MEMKCGLALGEQGWQKKRMCDFMRNKQIHQVRRR
jgi:hypothetical protein